MDDVRLSSGTALTCPAPPLFPYPAYSASTARSSAAAKIVHEPRALLSQHDHAGWRRLRLLFLFATTATTMAATAFDQGVTSWHAGEVKLQTEMGYHDEVSDLYQVVRPAMPFQHQQFFGSNVSFLPLTTLDSAGRPWVSLLAAEDGEPGFMLARNAKVLLMRVHTWEGDPILDNLKEDTLVAGVGVELSTRRRNKLAGKVIGFLKEGQDVDLALAINEATGNCPKYIGLRQLEPTKGSSPSLALSGELSAPSDILPDEVIKFILSQGTVFLGTSFVDPAGKASHLGCNHRGGRAGFVRVQDNKREIVLPDYSGNRFYSSLGNIQQTPVAGLAIPCFETGDVLYLTGEARNLWGEEAEKVMLRTRLITVINVTGYRLVRNALPFRQTASPTQDSPYNPPIKFLASEKSQLETREDTASLVAVRPHRSLGKRDFDLATFVFETSQPLTGTKAGQYAVLDMRPLIGQIQYNHMADSQPRVVNDDGIRTWTISSAPDPAKPNRFEITMRKISNGIVTPELFFHARDYEYDIERLGQKYPLLGVGGTFTLPEVEAGGKREKMLWLAGGIGATPFFSFLRALKLKAEQEGAVKPEEVDVVLGISTREPAIFLGLLKDALAGSGSSSSKGIGKLAIHLFVNKPSAFEGLQVPELGEGVTVELHSTRLTTEHLQAVEELNGRRIYLCGPPEYEDKVLEMLKEVGLEDKAIERESFSY